MSDDHETVDRETCTCDELLYLRAVCPPLAGLRVLILNGSDRLLVVCGVCGRVVHVFVLNGVTEGLLCELCEVRRKEGMT